MTQVLDELGPDFEKHWHRTESGLRDQLMDELDELTAFLAEDDLPLLNTPLYNTHTFNDKASSFTLASEEKPASKTASEKFNQPASTSASVTSSSTTQGSLFSDNSSKLSADITNSITTPAATKENPFLPKHILDRLHNNHAQTHPTLQQLPPNPALNLSAPTNASTASPVSHEQVDLERELRLRLGPIIENLIEAQVATLKSELRIRLRAEMDKLIAEQIRK